MEHAIMLSRRAEYEWCKWISRLQFTVCSPQTFYQIFDAGVLTEVEDDCSDILWTILRTLESIDKGVKSGNLLLVYQFLMY